MGRAAGGRGVCCPRSGVGRDLWVGEGGRVSCCEERAAGGKGVGCAWLLGVGRG